MRIISSSSSSLLFHWTDVYFPGDEVLGAGGGGSSDPAGAGAEGSADFEFHKMRSAATVVHKDVSLSCGCVMCCDALLALLFPSSGEVLPQPHQASGTAGQGHWAAAQTIHQWGEGCSCHAGAACAPSPPATSITRFLRLALTLALLFFHSNSISLHHRPYRRPFPPHVAPRNQKTASPTISGGGFTSVPPSTWTWKRRTMFPSTSS